MVMQLKSLMAFRPSAVSAKLQDSLVDRSEQLHIIPSTYDIEAALEPRYQGSDESSFKSRLSRRP